ncbi:MAG: hypothetical protein ACYS9T_01565 [Planctomycetota bacterium]
MKNCFSYIICFILTISISPTYASHKYVSHVTIAQNSSTVAFFLNEDKYGPIAIAGPKIRKRVMDIGWCNISKPHDIKRIGIDTLGKEFGGWGGEPAPKSIKFSPDSRKIGVLTPNTLSIVNLKTNKLQLSIDTQRKLSTYQWLSDKEIGYVTHEAPAPADLYAIEGLGYDSDSVSRSSWRQKIDSKERSLIHKDRGEFMRATHEFGGTFPLREQSEYWSPNGKYAIYISDYQFKLLDIQKKKVQVIGKGFESRVCWKSDSSAAFCTSEDNKVAFLVGPEAGKVRDYSKNLKQSISGTYIAASLGTLNMLEGLSLESWTYNDKFLMFNACLGPGGYLIQLDPWRVIETKKQLAKFIVFDNSRPPYILPIPIDNAIGVYSQSMSIARLNDAGDIKEVKTIIRNASGPGTFTPDGKYLVISAGDKIKVHEIGFSGDIKK